MPWLVKQVDKNSNDDDMIDMEKNEKPLLLVHVPRCGGTSLVKHFRVIKKAKKGRNLYHRIGLTYFAYRYALLEKANFPFKTFENLYALAVITFGFLLWILVPDWDIDACEGHRWCPPPLAISSWVMGTITFILSTFIMNTTMARYDLTRRFLCWCFGGLLNEFSATIPYLHGIGSQGYLMHFTAEKMIKHKYIEPRHLDHSFAIIRNPFSRFVSIYQYNKIGPFESFESFTKAWFKKYQRYVAKNSTEERDVYCHVLPIHEFIFDNRTGKQLVPNVIYQEDLKIITSEEGRETDLFKAKYAGLPDHVLQALIDMPHKNSRKSKKKWFEYYSQETYEMVLEMYHMDFQLFGYSMEIQQRNDLQLPVKSFSSSNFVARHSKKGRSFETPETFTRTKRQTSTSSSCSGSGFNSDSDSSESTNTSSSSSSASSSPVSSPRSSSQTRDPLTKPKTFSGVVVTV